MIRNVDLVSYLPPFMAEFQEIHAALTAENPEFQAVWEAANRALQNAFIATADAYGIARFERILNLYPSIEDTLESRRTKVQARWFTGSFYTILWLQSWLEVNCGAETYKITVSDYSIEIQLDYDVLPNAANLIASLKEMLETILPANMLLLIVPVSTSLPPVYTAAVPFCCEIVDEAMAECY